MLDAILLGLVLLCSTVYFVFLLLILGGLKKIKRGLPENRAKENPFISIIVPCRNESINITNNITGLLAQNYPPYLYEILYIDDHSTDRMNDIISSYNDKRIRLFHLGNSPERLTGKKHAIAYGLEYAKGEIIVATDADCAYSPNWLTTIAQNFDNETGFLSAPVAFHKKNGLFQAMQAAEFAGLVLTGAGLIGLNHPTICNGANIAYRKSLFHQVNGFVDNHGLASGDDELLMRKIHKLGTYKVKFAGNTDAVVYTHAAGTLVEFINQRARWASKGLYYNNLFVLFALVPIFIFFLNLLVLPILGILYKISFLVLFIVIFFIKTVLESIIIKNGNTFLRTKIRLIEFMFTQALHPLYIVSSVLLGTFKSYTWKDRVIRH